jgi:CRISPR-associated protein Cas6
MIDDLVMPASAETPPKIPTEMMDVVFDLSGTHVPEGYPFALWAAIVDFLPGLNEVQNAGILPLRGSASGETTLLSRRTKLILRVPASFAAQTLLLSKKQITIGDCELLIGAGKERPILAAPTLHAHIVESVLSEVDFLTEMHSQLKHLDISANLICDKHRKISSASKTISGFGLVVHDLKPHASLQIQHFGLGGSRHFGCGLFVPFKVISGLDS